MSMQERKITSPTGAVLVARELRKNGKNLKLDPCDRSMGQNKICNFRNPETLCKHPDGLLPEGGEVFCPMQRGKIQIIAEIKKV